MKKEQIKLIKINKVIGFLYLPPNPSDKAILLAKGGPSLGDNGKSLLWPVAKSKKMVLFIPDYIGYCRSDGIFDFQSCIETLYEAEDFLRGKISATDPKTGKKIKVSCKDILVIGSSWGGAIVPFLEKYRKTSIKTMGLLKPVTDWETQGKSKYQEEGIDEILKVIKIAWKNIYRGFSESKWPKIFAGSSEFNPIENLHLLKGKRVYICHGKKDKSVNWRKSEKFYKKLRNLNQDTEVFLKLFPNEDHSDELNVKGLRYILRNLEKGGDS